MKRPSLILATLLPLSAIAAFAAPAIADLQLKTATVRQIEVRSAAEVRRAFGFASTNSQQAIEITCSPANSSWCAKDFVTACDNAEGILSSSPDGGKEGSVVCSLPQHK